MKNNSSSGVATTAINEASTLVGKESSKAHDDYASDDSDEEVGVEASALKEFTDISPHPMEVLSHFIVVSDGSVKTPKYRCKCCKYEFTASSTTRLKQHIMGYEVYAHETPKKVVKDIKECSNPFGPLKDALIVEFNNNRAHKRPRESTIGPIDADGDGALQTPKNGRKKVRGNGDLPKAPITWNGKSLASFFFQTMISDRFRSPS